MKLSYRGEEPTKRTWPCLSFRSIPPIGDWGVDTVGGEKTGDKEYKQKNDLRFGGNNAQEIFRVLKKNHQVLVSA